MNYTLIMNGTIQIGCKANLRQALLQHSIYNNYIYIALICSLVHAGEQIK